MNATSVFSDLRAAAQSDSRIPVATAAGILLLGSLTTFILRPTQQKDNSGIVKLPGWLSSLTAWSFFAKRHDFMFNGFAKTGQELFQFRFLQHTVVAVSGEEGRKVFHNDKYLDFTQGYQILLGGVSLIYLLFLKLFQLIGFPRLHVLNSHQKQNGNRRIWPGSTRTWPCFSVKNVFQMVSETNCCFKT